MRNEFITGALIFIISTPVGYQLNDYLSRDRIEIQNVEVIPEKEKYIIDRKKLAVINNAREVNMFSSGGYALPDLPDKISIGQLIYLKRYINTKKASAELFNETLQSAIKKIKLLPNETSGEEAFDLLGLDSMQGLHFNLRSRDKKSIQQVLLRNEKLLSSYIATSTELVAEMDEFKSVRTGDFEVVVTLLNSGDTDGLIKYNGKMIIDKYDDSIPIHVTNPITNGETDILNYTAFGSLPEIRQSTKIEKRSMVQLSFRIDKDYTSGKIIKELEKLIHNEQPFDVSVQLKDFRNEPIKSSMYKSYATD